LTAFVISLKARVVEQVTIQENGRVGNLLNKINSISESNPLWEVKDAMYESDNEAAMMRSAFSASSIGDILEISTQRGLAYAQLTHSHPEWGALLWIAPGVWEQRPADVATLVDSADGFFSFVPLWELMKMGRAQVVGHSNVAESRTQFPLFRDYRQTDGEGRARGHRFWDGSKTWQVGDHLTPEQLRLPLRELPSPDLFIKRLEDGWRPELHERMVMDARKRRKQVLQHEPRVGIAVTRHYLYFDSEEAARAAAKQISRLRGVAETRRSVAPGEWLLLVTAPTAWTRDRADMAFAEIAAEFGGRYDGTETEIIHAQ
jgi:hypothetical protein